MLDLSRRMDKLKAFIHVSTFYSNCIRKTIDEKFYDPPISVLSTYQEPVPGWIDNIFGPTGAVVAGGAGLLRVVQADNSIRAELVPADFTVNALIASGWDVANKKNENDDPLIYNYCSSWNSTISFEQYWNLALKYGKQIPSVKSVWCYSITVVKNYYLYYILCLFLHVLPASLIDVASFITGRKTKAIEIYKKIHKFSAATSYFGLNEWNSKLDRTKSLWKRISVDDKKVFPFSMDNFNWEDYMKHYIDGLRLYIFKDTPDTIPAAKKRMSKIVLTHRIIKYIFLLFGVCASYIIISFILSLGWKNEFTFISEKFIER
ncbi:fatty acyl-CoA reductase wat-like isoform X2 [Belonocnema kinseyi]|uniref:fatty acyl-CoA reductase wat-like isoform X2 n=1 Tax=Belonocnema kinseyi TaxID=2817044 RepID=UPI00143D3DD1|nr:fatty acyl-CoA reductase wat-like isoform X2 [Belonocnema kinseyi]